MSQVLEHKNLLSKGKWLIPREAGVDPGAFTSEVGEKIQYSATGGFVPKQAEIHPMPNYVMDVINVVRGDQMDISGVHEVTQAKVPPGVKSGKALAYLLEQDDTQLGLTNAMFSESLNEVGGDQLLLIKAHYKEPRLMRYYGALHRPHVIKDFVGSQLKDTEDVYCEIGSALPSSRVARQDSVIELFGAQLMSPEEARRALEFGEWDSIYKESIIDQEEAQEENMKFDSMTDLAQINPNVLVGTAPDPSGMRDMIIGLSQPNSWNNDLVHIQEHNKRRKRPDFQQLPDIIKAIYEMHVNAHKQKYIAAAGEAVDPQARAIKGGQGGDLPGAPEPRKSPSQTGERATERTGGAGAEKKS